MRHGNADFKAGFFQQFACCCLHIGRDVAARHRVDRRAADRQPQAGHGHRADAKTAGQQHLAGQVAAQRHVGRQVRLVGAVGVVARVLDNHGMRSAAVDRAVQHRKRHPVAIGQ